MLDSLGGTAADPDSEAGQREAERHRRISLAYLDARHALRLAGRAAESAVERVCIHNQAALGVTELNALSAGLSALSTHWSAKHKAR